MNAERPKCPACGGTGQDSAGLDISGPLLGCKRCEGTGRISGARETNAESVREQRLSSGTVSGAPECHIQGWETMPAETKTAMTEMMWALKRALDSGWRPEPRRSATDEAQVRHGQEDVR